MKQKFVIFATIFILIFASTLSTVGMKIDNENEKRYEGKEIETSKDEEELKKPYRSGELIVKFKDIIGFESVNSIFYGKNLVDKEIIYKKKDCQDSSNLFKLSFSKDIDILSIIREFKNNPNIEYIEPNYIYEFCEIPNDGFFSKQWALHNTGTEGDEDCDIDAPEAWDITTGSDDVVIALIDSGIDYEHPDLKNKIWINPNEDLNGNGKYDLFDINFRDDDNNGYRDDIRGWNFNENNNNPIDYEGHGSHCGGIAAAESNNDIGIAGIAWDCKIMPLKVGGLYGIDTEEIIEALHYAADNGADIISMSFGGSFVSTAEIEALEYAYSKDVVLVAAAGNDDSSEPHYPAYFHSVIAVGATTCTDRRAYFSSYGDWVDVGAPGQDVFSTVERADYEHKDGTSMACPHVSGVAALVRSVHPELSNAYISTMIRYAVDEINYNNKKFIGNGRINAYKAVTMEPVAAVIEYDYEWRYNAKGIIEISGTADADDFQEYIIECKHKLSEDWITLKTSQDPADGSMFSFDTTNLIDGLYTVRLRVICERGEFEDKYDIVINNNQNTFYVDTNSAGSGDGSSEDPFVKIQNGVDNCGTGDKVIVKSGTYYESVTVDREIELIGEDKESVIIDCEEKSRLTVKADGVTIRGFTVINPFIVYAGIYVLFSSDVLVTDNIVKNSKDDGISLALSSYCTISNNYLTDIREDAISIGSGEYNEVIENEVYNNAYGIYLGSVFSDEGADYNIIRDNKVINNTEIGIQIKYDSNDNTIYRNVLIGNKANTQDKCKNSWDNGYKKDGCGNYYDDHTGPDMYNGPKQNNQGSDNIIDVPYEIADGECTDRYPLVDPDIEPQNKDTARKYFKNSLPRNIIFRSVKLFSDMYKNHFLFHFLGFI